MLRTILVVAFLAMFTLSAQAQPQARGLASWYGHQHHGRLMADGKKFDQWASTVAHRRLPLGTEILIRNLANGRTARATVTDRGPYVSGRILDLSRGLASRLDMIESGVTRVEYSVLTPGRGRARPRRT